MRSDNQLIQDCLKGNQLAYKQLYERYVSYCYGICSRYTIPASDLKDVIQIIFTQVFQSLKNYDSDKALFKTWLTRISINHILSYKRKKMRTFQTEEFDAQKEMKYNYLDNNIEEKIDKDYIIDLLKKMPTNYQIIFNLFIIDGYSHEEIAEQLAITTASSRVTLNRARKWMKKNIVTNLTS